MRYDSLDRGTEGKPENERDFERWTLGARYFFNKKTRFTLNYESRDLDVTGSWSNPNQQAAAKKIVGGMDDLLTARVLVIF